MICHITLIGKKMDSLQQNLKFGTFLSKTGNYTLYVAYSTLITCTPFWVTILSYATRS